MSQTATILRLLETHPDGITAFDALREAQCLRLAARIADLRAKGHRIDSTMVRTISGKKIARYRLAAA